MQSILQDCLRRMRYALQAIAPYLSLLLLPGGSLIFIALMASKHRPTSQLRPSSAGTSTHGMNRRITEDLNGRPTGW